MHESLNDVDRVDSLVFPLLELSTKSLQVPDAENNQRLSHFTRIIEKLINKSLRSKKQELARIGQYMAVFRKKPEFVIHELKRQSFILYQEQQLAEDAKLKQQQESFDESEES